MKLNNIDLNKLYIFCSVMRHQGYKGASEDLFITRSAISQAIHLLEKTLDVKLFQRIGTSLIPTLQAKKFYQKVLIYQQGLETSISELTEKVQKPKGLLRVGSYLEFAQNKLMPTIDEFIKKYPDVQLKLTFDSPSRLETLLEEYKLDLTISIFPHTRHKLVDSKKLYQEELVLIGHQKLVKKNPSENDLKQLPVIDYFPNHLLIKRWWSFHFKKSLPRNILIKTYASNADMVFQLIKKGYGIGIIPAYLLETQSHSNLVVINPTQRKLKDYIWINQPEISQNSSSCQAFLNILRKYFPIPVN